MASESLRKIIQEGLEINLFDKKLSLNSHIMVHQLHTFKKSKEISRTANCNKKNL